MVDVIYIEDEDMVALIFKIGLTAQEINVLIIPDDSPESLALLDTPEYQAAKAVFLDMWVVGASGVEIAQTLRDKGDSRPFFLLTAGENPDPARLKELNVTFLRKPVGDYKKLASMIRDL
jgi:DNA-binding response OmpR family regulator